MRALGLKARSRVGTKVAFTVQPEAIAVARFCRRHVAGKITVALAHELHGVRGSAGARFLVRLEDELHALASRRPDSKMHPARRRHFRADRQPSLEVRLSHCEISCQSVVCPWMVASF